MGFVNPILGSGGALVRSAIRSPNFLAGSRGWTVRRNGSAEFNDIVIRGGTTVSGDFLAYAGVPAAGNLILSMSAAGGTDEFGNAYGVGVISYGNRSGTDYFTALTEAELTLGKIGQALPGFVQYFASSPAKELFISSGREAVTYGPGAISLVSESAAGANDAHIDLIADRVDVLGNLTAGNLAWGRVSVTIATASTAASVTVTGLGVGGTAFQCLTSPLGSAPSVGLTTAASSINTSSVIIWANRSTVGSQLVAYLVIGV